MAQAPERGVGAQEAIGGGTFGLTTRRRPGGEAVPPRSCLLWTLCEDLPALRRFRRDGVTVCLDLWFADTCKQVELANASRETERRAVQQEPNQQLSAGMSNDTHAEYEPIAGLPVSERNADPLHAAMIRRAIGGAVYTGFVVDIGVGKRTGERLYHIRYCDDDEEDVTTQQVREHLWMPTPQASPIEQYLGTRNCAYRMKRYVIRREQYSDSDFDPSEEEAGSLHTAIYSGGSVF